MPITISTRRPWVHSRLPRVVARSGDVLVYQNVVGTADLLGPVYYLDFTAPLRLIAETRPGGVAGRPMDEICYSFPMSLTAKQERFAQLVRGPDNSQADAYTLACETAKDTPMDFFYQRASRLVARLMPG